MLEIESDMTGLQEKYLQSLGMQGQYNQVSESLLVKINHGVMNNENLLASTICNLNRIDEFKLRDFLISYTLLQEKILTRPNFKNSMYIQDPNLFYSLSHSLMLRADPKGKIYFMVMTPITFARKRLKTELMNGASRLIGAPLRQWIQQLRILFPFCLKHFQKHVSS